MRRTARARTVAALVAVLTAANGCLSERPPIVDDLTRRAVLTATLQCDWPRLRQIEAENGTAVVEAALKELVETTHELGAVEGQEALRHLSGGVAE